MAKKGISPLIATILLIVMTVGIAGLMYVWLSGTFSSLQNTANKGLLGVTQQVYFSLSTGTINSTTIQFEFYNSQSSTIAVNLTACTYILQVTPPGQSTQTNILSNLLNLATNLTTASNSPVIYPGQQTWVTINITTTPISSSYSPANTYLLTMTCNGVTQSLTLSTS